MRKLLLGAATLITSVGLVGSVAAAQTGGGIIDNTGPGSDASIRTKIKTKAKIDNNNDIRVSNTNSQTAETGDARVSRNVRGGNAVSGDAKNRNSFRLEANVKNNSGHVVDAAVVGTPFAGGGRISDTGPGSDATISTRVQTSTKVENDNDFQITNTNVQTAESGDATVTNNNAGGNAVSGDAKNSNSTTIKLNVRN